MRAMKSRIKGARARSKSWRRSAVSCADEPFFSSRRRELAPIHLSQRQFGARHHLLPRLWNILPAKLRAQDGVTLDDLVPGAHEQAHVAALVQRDDDLLDIHAGLLLADSVEQHALLLGDKS